MRYINQFQLVLTNVIFNITHTKDINYASSSFYVHHYVFKMNQILLPIIHLGMSAITSDNYSPKAKSTT